jgi:hypothetical protein
VPDAGDPDRYEERRQVNDLHGDEQRAVLGAVVGTDASGDGQLRPAVRGLPPQVGRGNDRGDQDPGDEPSAAQRLAGPDGENPGE